MSLLHLSLCYSIIAIIVIMEVITIIQIIDLIAFIQVVGINWFTGCLRDRPRKSYSVLNTNSEYPGKMQFLPVGDTGTIPHHLRHHFPWAPGDRRQGSGGGCRMSRWLVNSWALGWSRDM